MQSTTVARGDLLFLWHPDTPSIFSGFGLAVEAGRADLLIGLLIVDRPFPVSEAWLEEIEQTFGGFELYAMTATHDHGIACQMRVEADSLPYVRALDMPLAHLLRHALVPLLAQPPQPRYRGPLSFWGHGRRLGRPVRGRQARERACPATWQPLVQRLQAKRRNQDVGYHPPTASHASRRSSSGGPSNDQQRRSRR